MASQKNWVTFDNPGFDTNEDTSSNSRAGAGPSQPSNDYANLSLGDASYSNDNYIANDVSRSSSHGSSQGSYYGQRPSSSKPSPVVSSSVRMRCINLFQRFQHIYFINSIAISLRESLLIQYFRLQTRLPDRNCDKIGTIRWQA